MTDPVGSVIAAPEGDNPFWRFSLRLYRRTGVPAACLDFQDRAGWDVNLLLFTLWAGGDCGVKLGLAELDRIDGVIAPWRADVVRPLRQIRRRVRDDDDGLYARVKADELQAEKIQQSRMYEASGLFPQPLGAEAALAAAASNLDALLERNGMTDADRSARSALLTALAGMLAEQAG